MQIRQQPITSLGLALSLGRTIWGPNWWPPWFDLRVLVCVIIEFWRCTLSFRDGSNCEMLGV